MDEMMNIDLAGGAGVDSLDNLKRLRYDSRRTLKTQLELAEFSGLMPGDIICTTDTIATDPVQSSFAPVQQPQVPSASVTSVPGSQDQKLSFDTVSSIPTL